jgi:hypothetical protein
MKELISLLIGFVSLASTINTSSATIINVPSSQPTIQAGINAASPGDTVLVQPGRYVENIDFKGKDIVVGSMFITTRDTSYISQTVIDANKKGSVVTFKNGETKKAELCGVTITGGYTTYQGEFGMYLLSWGSGIYCLSASPYLHHLVVEGNFTDLEGGGIYLEKSNSVIEYCAIRNNRGVIGAGGLHIINGNHQIKNCVIESNIGLRGSGISSEYSTLKLNRVLIIKSQSYNIYILSSTIFLTNCSIINNLDTSDACLFSLSTIYVINSIIWNNSKNQIDSGIQSNIYVAYSDLKGGKESIKNNGDSIIHYENNINLDPSLNSNYTLSKYSPCIDTGISFYKVDDSTLVNLNENEYKGKAPDMGTFESDYPLKVSNYNAASRLTLDSFPNPFNSSTIIRYSILKRSQVNLSIYSITGQKVIDLIDKSFPIGIYQTNWNGTDKSGNKISSGIYVIQLNTGSNSISKNIVFIK